MIRFEDVVRAKKFLENLIEKTPVVRCQFLSEFCGGEVYLKLENLQISNSCKIRGAFNKMLTLGSEMKQGVVAASSGNHGIAVAIAAKKLNLPVKIVVPKNTPKVKIEKIMRYDVELVLYGNIYDDAERKALELARNEELTYISPYNDNFVIAGQGTIGLEILDVLPDVNVVVVPVGSGGIISGISFAIKSIRPDVDIIGVQSEASPVMYESLKANKIVDVEIKESVADALSGGIERGSITFEIVKKYVKEVLLVKEETIKKAIYLLWKKEGQIVEGAGAAAVAAVLEHRELFMGKKTAAVITGGNIDEELFKKIVTAYENMRIRPEPSETE